MKSSKVLLIFAVLGVAMSGGIHRVAQSRWNVPQKGLATSLCLYFALDSDLPAAGYLLVGIPAGATFTPTGTGVHAWALTTSLAVPAKSSNAGTCAFANNVLDCTFASALTKNTAYGMVIPGDANAKVGQWGPVSMETRMNKLTQNTNGPVMDVNRVFDTINVAAAPKTIVVAGA
jgi:hypothetical protein